MHPPYTLFLNTIPLLGEETGVGTYTRQVAEGILARKDLFTTTCFHGVTSRGLPNPQQSFRDTCLQRLKEVLKKTPLLRTLGKKTLAYVRSIRAKLTAQTYDCYFEPNFVFLPEVDAKVFVLTVHDFSCFRYPEWHPKERVQWMERFFQPSLARASHIITVSRAMRAEACALFGIPEERITAIPNGYDPTLFHPMSRAECSPLLAPYALPQDFILFAGTLEPRKNLATLLDAYETLPRTLRERYPLLIAGGAGWENAELLERLTHTPATVRMLGYVPKEVLAALYSQATLLCYPSWYEGFGLPVLEAMACGCPVISSNHAALAETCGDCAVLVDPRDSDAMAQGLTTLLHDPERRQLMAHKGQAHAKHCTWERAVTAHVNLLHTLTSCKANNRTCSPAP